MSFQLGEYLLLEKLAQGGMADVFIAKTFGFGGTDQTLAVKVIRPDIASNKDFVQMFVDEAKLSVQLNHETIGQTYKLGKIDGVHFMAMELILGRDLRALIDRLRADNQRLIPEFCIHISAQVCAALDYAHTKTDLSGNLLGIVHQDVSPANVIVGYDGSVKLIDFGIAKVETNQGQSIRGKFGYMAPEQARGESPDLRTDIFAAGILLYELITGERLYDGASNKSVVEKVKHVEVFPPSVLIPEVDKELEDIVLKALSMDPDERFQSASAMRDQLIALALNKYGPPQPRKLASFMQGAFKKERFDAMTLFEKARKVHSLPEKTELLPQAVKYREEHPEETRSIQLSVSQNEKQNEKQEEIRDVIQDVKPESIPAAIVDNAFPRSKAARSKDWVVATFTIFLALSITLTTWFTTRPNQSHECGALVIITTPSGAHVSIGKENLGITPYSVHNIVTGSHQILISKDGFTPLKKDVLIKKGGVIQLDLTLSP
ncbi:serine/threonine protein kinase [Myxococcota bacterium]|nr:serine/threonine protein kinase [Myxococcota bacterium]